MTRKTILNEELTRLARARAVELASLEESFTAENKRKQEEHARQIEALGLKYSLKAQRIQQSQESERRIIASLEEDYQLMGNRNAILGFDVDQVDKARAFLKRASKLPNISRADMLKLIGPVADHDMKEIIELLSKTQMKNAIVNSYLAGGLASDGQDNSCLLLISSKDKNAENPLASNLEEKVFEVLDTKTASIKPGLVVQYEFDIDYLGGFTVFNLRHNTNDVQRIKMIQEFLVQKFADENIQPRGFREANLVHKVQQVRFYDLNLPGADTNNPTMPVAQSRARKYKTERRLNFTSEDPEAIRQEAYTRINAVSGDKLTAKDLANVMGITYSRARILMLTDELSRIEESGSGPYGKVYFVDKAKVRKYLGTLNPTIKGWRNQ